MAAEVQPDVAFVDSILADDYSHTHANGIVQSKAEFMQGLKSASHGYALLDLTDVHARAYDATVVVAGTSTLREPIWASRQAKDATCFPNSGSSKAASCAAAWLTLRLPAPAAGQ